MSLSLARRKDALRDACRAASESDRDQRREREEGGSVIAGVAFSDRHNAASAPAWPDGRRAGTAAHAVAGAVSSCRWPAARVQREDSGRGEGSCSGWQTPA